jgi:8-oxo-dGTP pyrophosphatase MutT (NUDIX family)
LPGVMTECARRPARVLVMDAADRLLLVRSLFTSTFNSTGPRSGFAWLTPGGGAEAGADPASAASRELHEDPDLGH